VQDATRQALDEIAGRCAGVYEITALDKLPQPPTGHSVGYYLELNGAIGFGPFLTQIDFDCRTPQNLALNQLLDAVARKGPTESKSSGEDEKRTSCQSDTDCHGIAILCYEGLCR